MASLIFSDNAHDNFAPSSPLLKPDSIDQNVRRRKQNGNRCDYCEGCEDDQAKPENNQC